MRRRWQVYLTGVKKRYHNIIANDDTHLLAEQMEHFVPQFSLELTFYRGLALVLIWAFFVTGFKLETVPSLQALLIDFLLEICMTGLTLLPSVFFIRLQNQYFKSIGLTRIVIRTLLTVTTISILVGFMILFSANLLGVVQLTLKDIIVQVVSHVLDVLTLTGLILVLSIRRHRELQQIKKFFYKKLETQNDHIKTRLAPHFFFNTINSLASLIEIDSNKASELIQHVSHLFRASFNDPKESSFEEEVELCEHYLAIEKYRLQDKLVVIWDLPDEDLIYDMSITSLTLQNVLEQTVLHVVEMTTDTVYILIQARWQNNLVTIVVSAELPTNMFATPHNLAKRINFSVQQSRLQQHFGATATITTNIAENRVVNTITYALHDAFG